MDIGDKLRLRRLSISTTGVTTDVTQSAETLSEALDQEFGYFRRTNKIPAQINIYDDKEKKED